MRPLLPALFFTAVLALPKSARAEDPPSLRFASGAAVVTRGENEVMRVPLNLEKPVAGHPGVGNSAFVLVANCFVVFREVHDLGPTCHTPPVNVVEITALSGADHETKRFRWLRSTVQGISFPSPAGDWGIVISGTRSNANGFLIVKSDGSHITKAIARPVDWGSSFGKVLFTEDTATFPSVLEDGQAMSLVIHRTGEFELMPLASTEASVPVVPVAPAAAP